MAPKGKPTCSNQAQATEPWFKREEERGGGVGGTMPWPGSLCVMHELWAGWTAWKGSAMTRVWQMTLVQQTAEPLDRGLKLNRASHSVLVNFKT